MSVHTVFVLRTLKNLFAGHPIALMPVRSFAVSLITALLCHLQLFVPVHMSSGHEVIRYPLYRLEAGVESGVL